MLQEELSRKTEDMIGNRKVKICLVGAGRMGSRWAQIIAENNKAKLALVVDVDEKTGKELARKHLAFYSPLFNKKLLDEQSIDAVFVVVPHQYLAQNVRLALTCVRPVFVEKPGAKNAAEIKSLISLARQKNKTLVVGFNYRYFDGVSRAKKIAESGKIGKILHLRLVHGHAGRPGYAKEWRMDKKAAGGGALMDQGVHLLDLAKWFLPGKIIQVESSLQNLFWRTKVEDNAFLLLQTNQGQIASLHVSLTSWQPIFRLEIIGIKGYCEVQGVGRKYGGKEVLKWGVVKNNGSRSEHTVKCNSDPDLCLRQELAIFIKSIKSKKADLASAENALEILQIIGKVYDRRHK